MKINSKTRLRVSRDINLKLGLSWWDTYSLKVVMLRDYGLILTSKRYNCFYFKPTDTQKCMLFIIGYGEMLKQKAKRSNYE